MSESHHGEHDSASRPLATRSLTVAPKRSLRAYAVIAGFFLFAAVLFLFYQVHGFLADMEACLAVNNGGEIRLTTMGRQMDDLRGRLNGILADSVEIRLKSLEKNIASGQVGGEELQSFQALQNDLKLLENFSRETGAAALDDVVREHPRYRTAAAGTQTPLGNQELIREIARLRGLFYLCLTGLAAGTGLMTARYFWIRARKSPFLPPVTPRQRRLARRRPD